MAQITQIKRRLMLRPLRGRTFYPTQPGRKVNFSLCRDCIKNSGCAAAEHGNFRDKEGYL
ncbi:MAG: hypothetical protein KJ893_08580 [Candidatus Omnitrophica bacterium]|nr:hypothetical protein [Candidatus Omnitrophota bacterium]